MRALALLLLLAGPAAGRESDEFEGRPSILFPGGLILYQDTSGPLSFGALTPKDRPSGSALLGPVSARSCQHGLALPVTASLRPTTISGARGEGSYRKALTRLAAKYPDLGGILDVKVDMHAVSILGFYRRLCTEVNALGFRKPEPGPSPAPSPR